MPIVILVIPLTRSSPHPGRSRGRQEARRHAELALCDTRAGKFIYIFSSSGRIGEKCLLEPSYIQPFHTDLCDVLSLYALNVAAYGGESFLASSAKIYNELARTRPDIIEVLAKDDWIFDECVHSFNPLHDMCHLSFPFPFPFPFPF